MNRRARRIGRTGPGIRSGCVAIGALLVLLLVLAVVGCGSAPPPGLAEQGDAAWAAGEYREADTLYAQALQEDPASRTALLGRARVAVQLRDPEQALGFHVALAQADREYWQSAARSDYALALFEAGQVRLATGHPDGAVAALRAVRQIDPDRAGLADLFAQALTARAEQLAMRGDPDAALDLYQEAIGVDARVVAAYVGAAEILIGSGRKQEAMALLEVARETDPADNRVRALTLEAMGLY